MLSYTERNMNNLYHKLYRAVTFVSHNTVDQGNDNEKPKIHHECINKKVTQSCIKYLDKDDAAYVNKMIRVYAEIAEEEVKTEEGVDSDNTEWFKKQHTRLTALFSKYGVDTENDLFNVRLTHPD